jgi:hypothetical protein
LEDELQQIKLNEKIQRLESHGFTGENLLKTSGQWFTFLDITSSRIEGTLFENINNFIRSIATTGGQREN